MRVDLSPEAAAAIRERGGQLWVWTARPRLCCGGTPVSIRAATEPPADRTGFRLVRRTDAQIWFRPPGRVPDVLEIGVSGRRQPRIEAYWDGLRMVP